MNKTYVIILIVVVLTAVSMFLILKGNNSLEKDNKGNPTLLSSWNDKQTKELYCGENCICTRMRDKVCRNQQEKEELRKLYNEGLLTENTKQEHIPL